VEEGGKATLNTVADHIEHIAKVAGRAQYVFLLFTETMQAFTPVLALGLVVTLMV
jgi:hypothetical protein